MTDEKQSWDDESWRRDPKNWDVGNLRKGKTLWGEPVDRESEDYKNNAVIGECLMLCDRFRKTKEALETADEKRARIFKLQDELVDSGQKDDDTPAFDVATGGKFKKRDFTGFEYE